MSPYPEVTYNLNPDDYSEGSHTIRATATDKSGNVNSASIDITIEGEDGIIPGYYITTLIFGSIIGVVLIYFIHKKRIKNRN